MKKISKFGTLFAATALTLGFTASIGHAQTPVETPIEKMAIEVQSTEVQVSKEVLIQKLKELFPGKFDFLSTNDFNMSNAHHYPDDERIRYELSFHKTIKGKDVYGSISFVGEKLEIEQFYYEPLSSADALFPAKVSKEEAQKIAADFLKKLPNGKEYELDTSNVDYYYYSNQLITEPIRYNFLFVQKQNNIPVSDQQVQITVLGNGDITQFYRNTLVGKKVTFEDAKKAKSEQEVLTKVKNNLSVSLKYQIQYNYKTGKESVALVYQPSINGYGINAITGEWQTANGFSKDAPKQPKVEKLSKTALPPKQKNITVDDAKKMAEQLLKIDSDKVKLTIDSVQEIKNQDGITLLSVNYSYNWEHGGFGASLEFNKATGEIISYYDVKSEVLRDIGELKNDKQISKNDALTKANEYVKQWIPSYLHNYAKPTGEPYFEKERGIYHITFPRVVNSILVEGNQISVAINPDGSLNSLHVNHREIENWPSTKDIISNTDAKNQFMNALNLKLQYVKLDSEATNYNLVYSPLYNKDPHSYLDANTGKWNSVFGEIEFPIVTHPTAEAELNYLIQNQILEVEDAEKFNADTHISNGEALEILVKSLSYFYEYEIPEEESVNQTFPNIAPAHPLYQVVERAVRMGILDPNDTFNPYIKLSREQLAVWYIRVAGLELAAKNADIYKLNLSDAGSVQSKYVGYVALANALQLITAENNQFNPKGEVTYANIAKSIFTLARLIHENGNPIRYY